MALPSPTLLAPTSRYIPAGLRRYSFVPTILVKTAPTSVELTAGTDLTFEVASLTGFATTSATVPTPDAGSRFTGQTAGRITADNSMITLYASTNGVDGRTLLTRDLVGFFVIYNEGIVASGKMSVFPIKVIGVPLAQDIEAAATFEVQVVVTSLPSENIAIPIV